MIYLVTDGVFTKIGTTTNALNRLINLQTANARKLVLICVIEGGWDEEQALHKMFEHKKVRGEWFNLTKEDVDYIRDNFVNENKVWFQSYIDKGYAIIRFDD